MGRYHIKIEGTDEEQMRKFFEEVQNKYSLYDNCVFEECEDEDSFIEPEDRCGETGNIICERPEYKEAENKVKRLEAEAKKRFIENSDWDAVINMLDEDEKKELNENYKKDVGEDYPSLKGD